MLKSNKLLFSALAHVPGNPMSSGAKGRGKGSRICTKLLLSHKAAKLHSPADSNRRLITPAKVQMVAWMQVADLQSSMFYVLVLHFIAEDLDTKWKSGTGVWKSYLCPEVKPMRTAPARLFWPQSHSVGSRRCHPPLLSLPRLNHPAPVFLPFTLFSHNQNTYCIFQLTCKVI